MRTVKEVSRLMGISVRTLHYYDAIGLLRPTEVSPAGYRLYDDAALRRLQNILLFRQLQFPLKEIKAMLDNPAFDPKQALSQQIHLLELQQKRIESLISFARNLQKGETTQMDFQSFQNSEFEQYAAEVRAKWGASAAYQEYEERLLSRQQPAKAARGLMELFSQIGALKHLSPDAEIVQNQISALQAFITKHYYHCTEQILNGLGQLYICDVRMKENIDAAGGEGTAAFARQAIAIYCGKIRGTVLA